MVMQDKVVINGIDVTSKRTKWLFGAEWDSAIDVLSVELASSVTDLVTITAGMTIEITRGLITSTDEIVFTGIITQVQPDVAKTKIMCKNNMIDAVKSAQTKSWDKDIDTEAGVGSEIFKALCDNSSLDYDATSITSTGTATINKITKFIQNDEDDFQKMNELAEHYNYIISYDYDNGWVNFKPKGFSNYGATLTVGIDIPGQLKWKENMEQLINKVKVNGATVYDKVVNTFAGPATTFTFTKTPEDTEVHINYATTDDLQVRGQKDIGILGTNFDYYVDTEQKTMTFAADVSDVWTNFGAQVPLPIVVSNVTSINTYGGPNKKPHFKNFFFNDIKDKKDAEDRGRAILSKYATPFIEVRDIPVVDSVISANGSFKPGHIVHVIDSFNNKDSDYFISGIKKAWPHVYDKITIGDQIWRTEDWQSTQMKKINQLFNELNKNQDLTTETLDLPRDIKTERRYTLGQVKDRSGDGVNTFILSHPTFGVLGTQELGDAGTAATNFSLIPGNNIFKEYCYDTTFHDVGSTTATFDTTAKEITFTSGQVWYSGAISYGITWAKYTVALGNTTGTLTVEISADGKSNWETVTLDTLTVIAASDSTGFYMRITEAGASTASVETTFDTYDDYDEPAIKITFEE